MTDAGMEQRAKEFYNTLPHCCGYPDCDGDLVAIDHNECCPLYDKKEMTKLEFAVAFAASEVATLETRVRELKTLVACANKLFGKVITAHLADSLISDDLGDEISKLSCDIDSAMVKLPAALAEKLETK